VRHKPFLLRRDLGVRGMLARAPVSCLVTALTLTLIACAEEESASPNAEGPSSVLPTASPVAWMPVPATYPPAEMPVQEDFGLTEWSRGLARSLEEMSAWHSTIIVGQGVGVDVGYPWADFVIAHFFGPGGETPPPGHPKADSETPDPSGPHWASHLQLPGRGSVRDQVGWLEAGR